MARSKQTDEFDIEVDGEAYVWRMQRKPKWSSLESERRGYAVSVRHAEGQREAVIEFPPGPQPRLGSAQFKATQIPVALVARAIASAIAAGWEPLSRGKTVNIAVDAEGG